jgi:hypothetical protein
MTKAKAIRMPGKGRPAASRLGIQKPRRRSFTTGISPETRNPPLPSSSAMPQRVSITDSFRSQPRVIGSGSLRRARPRRTEAGRAVYKMRKAIVEPAFGQIKEVRGFRRFSLHGKENVRREWKLVCAVSNLLKLFRAGWVPEMA